MPEFTAAADVCLLPAQANDTMAHIVPAKIYEYLAAGKPILASPLPGLRAEFGDDSGIQYVADARSLLAAARRLAADPTGSSRLGAATRRRAELSGNWDEVTGKFLDTLSAARTTSVASARPGQRRLT
jgi:glycosyltransferase involved in cell wall biosynthesis